MTSDNTIKFTMGGVPVTTVSSQLLATNLAHTAADIETSREERSYSHMTLADRLSPEAREKLWKMLH